MAREKKKLALLIGLVAVFSGVLIYNGKSFWGGSASTGKSGSLTSSGRNGAKPSVATQPGQGRDEGFRPLPLYALERVKTASLQIQRNIFVYGPDAPPPETHSPPAPPPTLRLLTVNPAVIYARTGDIPLRVTAEAFPPDAQIFLNGQPQPTERVSPTELATTVSRSFVMSPGRLVLEVKNGRGDFSGPREIPVLEPPAPPYTYVGRIGDLVFLKKGDDRYAVRIGELVDAKKDPRWRVASATDANLVLQDVIIKVDHRLDMDLGQTASTPSDQMSPVQRMRGNRPRVVQPEIDEGNVPNEEEELLQQQQELLQEQLQMQQQMLLQQQLQGQFQQQQQPVLDPQANRLRQQLLQQRLQPWQRQQLEQQLLQQQLLQQQQQLQRMRGRPRE